MKPSDRHRRLLSVACSTAALLLSACGGGNSPAVLPGPPPTAPYGIEVIVRTSENFSTPADVTAFVDLAVQNGVTAINLLVKQDEDAAIASGSAFYASGILPRAPGYATFDVLQTMIDATRSHNIKVRAWVPQFHDQVAVVAHPDWQMIASIGGTAVPYTGSRQTEYFVNPLNPAVQDYERSILQEITTGYPVDGVMLDWLRFDNYNMDLGPTTRAAYQTLAGIDPLTMDFSVAGAARDQWNAFRMDGIAAYVHSVRQLLPANLTVGAYILPPEFIEVAQDANRFNADVGTLAPMCYFVDWGYAIEWLWSSCLAQTAQKAGSAAIVPAMDSQLSDAQYQQIFAHLHSQYPQIKTLAWFYHGRWDAARLQHLARLSRL